MKSHLFVALVSFLFTSLVSGTPTVACNALQIALPDRVFIPGSDEYPQDNEVDFARLAPKHLIAQFNQSLQLTLALSFESLQTATLSRFSLLKAGNTLSFLDSTQRQESRSRYPVYVHLDPFNVKVVGGRAPSVLVASYWAEVSVISTDQYGLAIDIIVAHDLALPDGISVVVTGASDPDLSFVLKGSFNDFDTVTAFTLKTHPPADIWISVQSLKRIVTNVFYPINSANAVHQSAAKWSANDDDHEAVVIPFYAYGSGQVCISSPSHATIPTALSVVIGNEPILFYYAPMQSSIFDQFTNAPGAVIQVSGVMSLTEASYAISGQVDRITLVRGSKHTIPNTKYTVTILDEMKTQLEDTTSDAQTKDRPLLGAYFAAEPYSQSNVQSADSVYPHPQGRFVRPRLIDVRWENAAEDEYFFNAVEEARQGVQAVVIADGRRFAKHNV
uniref:Uncharacterized protein n=1 Tax=Moniliophthora roreri TaxID=221103 RepID=A0A0W0FNI8_MONRR